MSKAEAGGCGGQRDWGGASLSGGPGGFSCAWVPLGNGSGEAGPPSGGPVKGAIVGLWAAARLVAAEGMHCCKES